MARSKLERTGNGTIAYKVLPTDSLPRPAKDLIDVKMRGIKTGVDAEILAGNDGWGYHKTFLPGTVGILTYKGVEVALYYRRQMIEVSSDECDPFPVGAIKDPKEAWVRIEFLHCKASVEKGAWFADQEKELLSKIANLEGLNKQRDQENELLHEAVDNLHKELDEQKELTKRYKERLLGKTKTGGIIQKKKVVKKK